MVYNLFCLPNSIQIIANSAKNLLLVIDNPTTKLRNITLNEKIDYHLKISYLQYHYILEYLKDYFFGDSAISFQKILTYLCTFKEIYSKFRCCTTYIKCKIDLKTNKFIYAWIMFIAIQKIFYYYKNFVAIHRIQIKDLFNVIISALTILDRNNQILLVS